MTADLWAGALAWGTVVGLGAAWRSLYPLSDAGLLALAALGLTAFAGAFHAARRRRRALLAAVLVPGSPLARLLGGALLPALVAFLTTALALPGFAFFTLTARAAEFALFAALAAVAVAGFLGLRRLLAPHLRPAFRSSFAAPWAVGAAAALFVPAHVYAVYALLPLPAHVDAESVDLAVLQALETLPRRGHLPAEILAALHAGEAAALWLLRSTGFAMPALLAYLGFGALVGFGLARVAVDVVTLFVALAVREESGDERG